MINLTKRIKRTSSNLRSKNTALLVIDVQEEFADPNYSPVGNKETKEAAERIASIMPAFRETSIHIYSFYWRYKDEKKEIDPFKFIPIEGIDTVIRKDADSAFKGSNIKHILVQNKIKNLLVCGFNISACVEKTILDAKKEKFNVYLLKDLSANNNCYGQKKADITLSKTLPENKVIIQTSQKILKSINALC